MYEAKVFEHFSDMPVFKLGDLTQIVENKEYAKKFLQRMVRQKKLYRIKRDFYTMHENPFLVSTFLVKPSYISSVSALSFHHLTTQIPRNVFCLTTKQPRTINFISEINFFHTKNFFGYKLEKYEKFYIPIATPEKAIIDSIGIVPFSVFEEAFEKIDAKLLADYLRKTKKSSIIKRIGYLAEKNGFDVYDRLKKFINNRYIFLDPLAKRKGEREKRWKVIING